MKVKLETKAFQPFHEELFIFLQQYNGYKVQVLLTLVLHAPISENLFSSSACERPGGALRGLDCRFLSSIFPWILLR